MSKQPTPADQLAIQDRALITPLWRWMDPKRREVVCVLAHVPQVYATGEWYQIPKAHRKVITEYIENFALNRETLNHCKQSVEL